MNGLSVTKPFLRKLTSREKRLLCYLGALLVFLGWYLFWRARWSPTLTVTTTHYVIYSSATSNATSEVAGKIEILYQAYSNCFRNFPQVSQSHPLLRLKLYKDRPEFRRCNPRVGWAEAFYRPPYCQAYYSAEEINSYHWMLHEAVHQLNSEVAGWQLSQWLNEGLATYFSSSLLVKNKLLLGNTDLHTYPAWWLDDLATSGSLESDLKNGSVIPLRVIISGKGGPSMNQYFNLYYLHWWTLTHFLMQSENGKCRDGLFALIKEGGSLAGFEKHVGPVDGIQKEWHRYVLGFKKSLSSKMPVNVEKRTSSSLRHGLETPFAENSYIAPIPHFQHIEGLCRVHADSIRFT